MPLITCPDCGKRHSDAALACPECGRPVAAHAIAPSPNRTPNLPPREGRSGLAGCLIVVAILSVIGIILFPSNRSNISSRENATNPANETTPPPTPQPEISDSARAVAAEQAAAARLAQKWDYSTSTDEMSSKVARYAKINSENSVSFDFPYAGPQHGTLTIRNHPSYGRDVLLNIREGQFLCTSYDGCTVRIRFDEAPAVAWRATGPADNSTTVLFIRNGDRFVQLLRKAKTVRIAAKIYQEGEPIFEFEVGGFDYVKYTGAR